MCVLCGGDGGDDCDEELIRVSLRGATTIQHSALGSFFGYLS